MICNPAIVGKEEGPIKKLNGFAEVADAYYAFAVFYFAQGGEVEPFAFPCGIAQSRSAQVTILCSFHHTMTVSASGSEMEFELTEGFGCKFDYNKMEVLFTGEGQEITLEKLEFYALTP